MKECPEQWKLDVNDRYRAAVGVVSSLAVASLALPIFFLKDIVGSGSGKSIVNMVSDSYGWVLLGWGWFLLGLSIVAAVIYQYFSAKWVKLAWGKKADRFGSPIGSDTVENWMDWSYGVMMFGFVGGVACMLFFMVRFSPPTESAPADSPNLCYIPTLMPQPALQFCQWPSRSTERVLFEPNRALLTSAAYQVIDSARKIVIANPDSIILLSSNTDTTGTVTTNTDLARQRSAVIRRSLMSAVGIPPNRIFTADLATLSLPVITGENVSEPSNRSVTIEILY